MQSRHDYEQRNDSELGWNHYRRHDRCQKLVPTAHLQLCESKARERRGQDDADGDNSGYDKAVEQRLRNVRLSSCGPDVVQQTGARQEWGRSGVHFSVGVGGAEQDPVEREDADQDDDGENQVCRQASTARHSASLGSSSANYLGQCLAKRAHRSPHSCLTWPSLAVSRQPLVGDQPIYRDKDDDQEQNRKGDSSGVTEVEEAP